MTCNKSLSLICLSCTLIGTPIEAFIRVESLAAVTQIVDGGRLRYRAFDVEQTHGDLPKHEVLLIAKGKYASDKKIVASVEELSKRSKNITEKKRHDLDQYLESIDRRYKRLYDETGKRNPHNPRSSGIPTGFTTVWNWLMTTPDTSKAIDEERRQKDVFYVLHHAAVTSELLLNKRSPPSNTNSNTRQYNYDDSSLTEALIAGVVSNPLKKLMDTSSPLGKKWKFTFEPMVNLVRGNVHKLAASTRQYVSMIHASLNALVPIIAISYLILILLR